MEKATSDRVLKVKTTKDLTGGMPPRVQAAILFCDILDFTNCSHPHQPNKVIVMLADYQRQIVLTLEMHGGAIDKLMGGGIVVPVGASGRQVVKAGWNRPSSVQGRT